MYQGQNKLFDLLVTAMWWRKTPTVCYICCSEVLKMWLWMKEIHFDPVLLQLQNGIFLKLNFSKLNLSFYILILNIMWVLQFASIHACATEGRPIYNCSLVCFHLIPWRTMANPLLKRSLLLPTALAQFTFSFLKHKGQMWRSHHQKAWVYKHEANNMLKLL